MDSTIRANVPDEKNAPHSSGFLMLPVVLVGLCSSVALSLIHI